MSIYYNISNLFPTFLVLLIFYDSNDVTYGIKFGGNLIWWI